MVRQGTDLLVFTTHERHMWVVFDGWELLDQLDAFNAAHVCVGDMNVEVARHDKDSRVRYVCIVQ